MTTLSSTPGARRLFLVSIVARLPLAMIGIALLIHAEHLCGSFAGAGLVAGAYAIATGVGGPVLGRLVDRRGQAIVLAPTVVATTALLGLMATLPAGSSLLLQVAIAAGIGLVSPPLAACVRSLIPSLLGDPDAARVAYAVDSTAVELTWVLGPPLALGIGAATSTGAALAAAGAILLLGTAAFVVQPATRAWSPVASPARVRGGSLHAPGMRTLVLVLTAVGVLVGAVEVAAPASAEALGTAAVGGVLIGVWSLGSLVGGILTTRRGGGAETATGLAQVLAFLAAGHVAVTLATGSVVALGATLFVAGLALAPAFATAYAMVERVAPAGTVTEAFAWLTTAMAIGTAAGAAGSGVLADGAGPASAFLVAGVAGIAAATITALRSGTLSDTSATTPALAAAAAPA